MRDHPVDESRSGERAADLALELVGCNKEVLGVGRASASLTERLAQQGCAVLLMVSDGDDDIAWQEAKDESFDAVLLSDELVGVRDAHTVLALAARKLKPAGVLVAWMPNLAHGDTRIALKQGEFRYGERGVLDGSQVESFTLEAIRSLFWRSGLLVVDTARVIVPLSGPQFGVTSYEARPESLRELLEDPEIETYEFVLRAVRDNGDQALADLTDRLHDLVDHVHGESARSALLRVELRQMENLSSELKGYQEHVLDQQRSIAEQQRSIAEQQRSIAEQQRSIDALTGHASGLEHNVEILTRSLEELHQRYVAVEAQYNEVLGRRTVQSTAPIRWVYDKLARRRKRT